MTATYKVNNQTYVLKSNTINVFVNQLQGFKNLKVVYANNQSSSLNLDKNLIQSGDQIYKFSIIDSEQTSKLSSLTGTVTYTLTNNSTQKTLTLSSDTTSLNGDLSIDFNKLVGFVPGIYTLSASITINGANHQRIVYGNTEITTATITYNAISISPSTSSNVTQVGKSNNYNAKIGTSVTLEYNQSAVYVTGTNPIFQ
ncbi:hypothetical protein IKS57_05580 [bacterium]|nr:hypothetical protein [bacterium]